MSVLCVKVFISKTIQTLDFYKCASCTWYIYLSRTASLGTIKASVRDCCVCYDNKSLNNVLNYRRKRLTALITSALSDINGQQSGYRKSKCITGRSPNNELLNSPFSFCINYTNTSENGCRSNSEKDDIFILSHAWDN